MSDETITVYYQGYGVILYKEVADELSLSDLQNISEKVVWNAIALNSELDIIRANIKLDERNM